MKDFLNKMQKNEEKINLPTGEKKKNQKTSAWKQTPDLSLMSIGRNFS